MPLKALLDGRPLLSFALPTSIEWEGLREASREGRLTMSCCGVVAVPKTFHRHGTRFFAHKTKHQDCDWVGESEEHERLKAAAAMAAIEAGVEAETEVSGPDWRADVLAGGKYAIEIQLSAQTTHVTKQRIERYQRAGIEVLWLMRKQPNDIRIGPGMRVIVLPDDATAWEKVVTDHTKLFVTGNLVWDEARVEDAPITWITVDYQCLRCGEVYAAKQWAIIRRAEVRGELSNSLVAARRISVQSQRFRAEPLTVDRPEVALRDECPVCRLRAPQDLLAPDEARLYPWRHNDGYHTHSAAYPGWRARPTPPQDRSGQPTPEAIEAWEHMLQRKRLDLDPAAVEHVRALQRAKWEADQQAERERKAADDRLRRLTESNRRLHLVRLAEDIERGAGSFKVKIERSNIDYANVDAVEFSFPYDQKLVAAIRRTFRAVKWKNERKVWRLELGYSSAMMNILTEISRFVWHLRGASLLAPTDGTDGADKHE